MHPIDAQSQKVIVFHRLEFKYLYCANFAISTASLGKPTTLTPNWKKMETKPVNIFFRIIL